MESTDTHERMDTFVERIRDTEDVAERHAIISELYDVLDVVTSSVEYDEFLKKLLPLILSQLNDDQSQ